MSCIKNAIYRVCIGVLLCFVFTILVIHVRAEQSEFLCTTNLVAEERIQDQEVLKDNAPNTARMIPETRHISLIPYIHAVMREATGPIPGGYEDKIVGIDGPAPETLMEARTVWDRVGVYKMSFKFPRRCFEHDGWFYYSGGSGYDFECGFAIEKGSTNVYRYSSKDIDDLKKLEKIEMFVYGNRKSRAKSMIVVNKAMQKCLEIQKETNPMTLAEARKIIVQSTIDPEGSLNTCFEYNDAFYFITNRNKTVMYKGGYAIKKGGGWIYRWVENDYHKELRLIPKTEYSAYEVRRTLKNLKEHGDAPPELIELWQKRADKGKAIPF